MADQSKNYFSLSYLTILIAIGLFFVLKTVLPQKLFDVAVAPTNGIVIDSMALTAMQQSEVDTANKQQLSLTEPLLDSHEIKTDDSSSLTDNTPPEIQTPTIAINASQYSSGYGNLESFYEKLYQLEKNKNKKVRVAYFSDSMTDGDFIVQDIRKEFQKTYGGRGVGFVGITSLSASSRGSVVHSFSKNWQNQSMLKTQNPRRPFGVDGQVAFISEDGTSWVRYQAGNLENSTALYNPTIFYGSSSANSANMTIRIDKDSIVKEKLYPTNLLNTYKLGGAPSSVKIDFTGATSVPFYGVNFDDGRGVHIDNFSLRGNSGLPLSLLDINLMNAFDQELHYDLIILHYGANVLHYSTKDYSWYEKAMKNVVNHLKACFPKANILIISTADKSDKVEGEMRTSIAVDPLLRSQAQYAEETQSGFLNLYKLMGGNGSMVDWVSNSLANKDYTHFSVKGSHKIGLLIYDDLNKGYLEFKKKKYGVEPATQINTNSTFD